MVDTKKPKRDWTVLLSTQLVVTALWSGVCGMIWRWERARPHDGGSGMLPGDWSHLFTHIALALAVTEIVFTTLCIVLIRWFKAAPQVLALHAVLVVLAAVVASVSF